MTARPFEDAVKDYLAPHEGAFNYTTMLNDLLDISRFETWVHEVSEFKAISNCTVLSSGCGSAGDLLAFMRAGASHVCGIEVSQGLADLALARFAGTAFAPALDMRVHDGLVLPYADRSFDIVFSMHVVEHTQDPQLYLAELFRVLKEDGVLFLDCPNRYYPVEQHIQIRYIHYLPTTIRDGLIRILVSQPVVRMLGTDTEYKLRTYMGCHFPSAAEIIRIFNAYKVACGLKLEQAFFHSYSKTRVPFVSGSSMYALGRPRTLTTFRMVVRKR